MTSRRFAVIGDPVGHSRSPAMHAAAYRALGLGHTYAAVRVSSGDLKSIVDRLRDGYYDGLNVTVPHKQRVLEFVDALDPSARVVGAANTLVRSAGGGVVAHNTDAPALAAELQRLAGRGELAYGMARRGLVLGSGGAARAAIAALGECGVEEIVVRARAFEDPARARQFVSAAPAPVLVQPWRASETSERSTAAVVQATSAGMRGADAGETAAEVVAWQTLGADAIALDLVYAPRNTPFLGMARARGLRCDDGLGMLARQGALAFELWLGLAAPLEAMRGALGEGS